MPLMPDYSFNPQCKKPSPKTGLFDKNDYRD